MTERSPSSKRPTADPRPPVMFNMFNGQNAPGDRHEYGVENNITPRYKGPGGVERLGEDIVAAAELGFRRMMLHTVMGGGPGHLITGNGRFSIPQLKWNALAKMIGEMVDAYPDIEIGPHFACLYQMNMASPFGPPSDQFDKYYDQFPSLVGDSKWERAFWEETRESWRDIGCTWMSGDNWMANRTVDRAVEVIHEEWAKRRFRIIGESIPVNIDEPEWGAELVDCWILSQTMVQRKALAGPKYVPGGAGHAGGSLQPVPEHVRGHWYTYHWVNRWNLIPGATNDAEAMAELMKLGWVVMHHNAEALAEACGLAGIDVETGLPAAKPKPSPRDEPATDDPETDLRIDRKTLLRKAVAHVRMQLDGIENLIEEADDPDDDDETRSRGVEDPPRRERGGRT